MGREGIGNRFSFQTVEKTGIKLEIDWGGKGHNLVGMRGSGEVNCMPAHLHCRWTDGVASSVYHVRWLYDRELCKNEQTDQNAIGS